MNALRWLLRGLFGILLTAQSYGADVAGPIPFRRIYAPAADPNLWPTGGRRYLPVKADEFERLVETATAELTGVPRANAGRISSAEFKASWDGERLSGEGLLTIDHAATSATLVALEPCNVILHEAKWSEPPSAAILGHDGRGRLQLLVERSGKLRVRWAVKCGASDMASAIDLQLPSAVSSRLTLDLPDEVRPELSAGLVSLAEGAKAGWQRWVVDLGGRSQLQMRLVNSDSGLTAHQFTAARQSSTYDLSPRGLDVESELLLDSPDGSLEAIRVQMDAGLTLVAARLNDQPIEWTTESRGDVTIAALRLPQPITGSGNAIRLTAIGAVTRDKSWRLPQMRPQAMLWQEGNAIVMVTHPLVVRRIEPHGSRQVKLAPLPAPLSGEMFEFQHYSGEAEIELEVGDPEKRCRVVEGVQVSVGSFELSGQLTADVRSTEGEFFNLQAALQSDWIIESVESSPAEALASWNVAQISEGERELTVRLAKAVAPKRPVRLKVTGRKPAGGDGRAKVDELSMLKFKDISSTPVLLNLQTTEAAELRLSGDQFLRQVDPRQLSIDDQQLFAEPPLGLTVFASESGTAEVFLVPRRPNYFAEIEVDAAIDQHTIQESCVLRCSPQSGAVERVVVHFSRKQPEVWRFSIADGPTIPSARLMSEMEQRELGLGSAGETWEVPLRTPRTAGFELRASRTVPFDSQQGVTLAFLPEASRQRGAVTVRAIASAPVAIQSSKLLASPADTSSATDLQTTRGTFRYEPGRDSLALHPPLKIARKDSINGADNSQAGAWVWTCHVDSKYSVGEAAVHWATLRIQSVGKTTATFGLPADAELRSVSVNNSLVSAAVRKASGKGPSFQVSLPDTSAFSTVVMEYATPQRLPQYAATVSPPIPTIDMAMLSRGWTIWLPPQFDALADELESTGKGQGISWRERLFGALGRSGEDAVFQPLSRSAWQRLFDDSGRDVLELEVLQNFLNRLDAALSDRSTTTSHNWAELLEAATAEQDKGELVLLIDRPALHEIGLQFDSVVSLPRASEQANVGGRVLQDAGLTVIAHGRTLLLTSAIEVAHHRDELIPLHPGFSYRLRAGTFSEEINRASSGPSTRFVRLRPWSEPVIETLPWASSPVVAAALSELRGWSAYTVKRNSDQPAITIVHHSGISSAAWAIFLLVVGIGPLRNTTVRLWIVTATLLGMAALILPITWVLFLSPALLGVLALLVLKSIVRVLPRSNSHAALQSGIAAMVAKTAIVAVAIGLCGVAAVGQEPAAERLSDVGPGHTKAHDAERTITESSAPRVAGNSSAAFVYKVFVPVDENQKPTDDPILVDEDLYTKLKAMSRRATASPQGFAVRSSHHRVSLVENAARSSLSLSELRSRYDIQVLSRDSTVHLRLGDGKTPPSVRSVKLDGQAVAYDLDLNRSEITVDIAEPGPYGIDIDYELIASDDSHRTAELWVNRTPVTTVELSTTVPSGSLEVMDGSSQYLLTGTSGATRTEIQPTDRIHLKWQSPAPDAVEPIDADEMLWVTVHPGSMVVDARLKLRTADRRLDQIRLAIDPRLRLVSPVGDDLPIRAARIVNGDPSTLELDLAKGEGERRNLDLRFMLSAASGIGNIRIPRVETVGARNVRRQLALTVDSALQYDEPLLPSDEIKPVSVADFLMEWGPTENRPQLALTIPRGTPAWVLSTRPREPQTTSDQLLSVDVGRQRTLIEFRAQLSTEGGQNHQLMVQAPATFTPHSVSLVAETAQRVQRWSRSSTGIITVFLSSPSSGKQQFLIRGEMVTPRNGQLPVPQFEILGVKVGKRQFTLIRQPEIVFEPDLLTGLRSLDGVIVESAVSGGRVVGSFEQPVEPHVIRWSPNELVMAGQFVTLMTREKEAWYAELDAIVDVGSGVLDTLRFQIPSQLGEPFEVGPSATYEVVSQPGITNRQLIVRPRTPITKRHRVKIRGRVILGTEDRLQVPEIALEGATELRRFVALPTQFELQQVAWETPFGLRPAKLPDAFQELGRDETVTTYEVLGDRFQASLKSIDRSAGTPAVSLADIHLVWSGRDRCHGLITFDLEPVGTSTAVIELPPDCRAMSFEVAGLPGRVQELAPGRFELQLGPPNLPQRIKVVFEGALSEGSARRQRRNFSVPRLVDVPVQTTIWTIYGPQGTGPGRPAGSETAASPAVLELARLRNIVKLLASGKELAADTSPEEMRRWQRPWEDRLAASQLLLRQLTSDERATYTADLKEVEEELSRLGLTTPKGAQLTAAPGWVVSTVAGKDAPFTCAVNGASESIEVAYPDAAADDRLRRWVYALDLLGLAVITGLASKRLVMRRWMIYALLFLTAMVAWQLLALSWIGLVAAFAIVVFAVRDRQQWNVAI